MWCDDDVTVREWKLVCIMYVPFFTLNFNWCSQVNSVYKIQRNGKKWKKLGRRERGNDASFFHFLHFFLTVQMSDKSLNFFTLKSRYLRMVYITSWHHHMQCTQNIFYYLLYSFPFYFSPFFLIHLPTWVAFFLNVIIITSLHFFVPILFHPKI